MSAQVPVICERTFRQIIAGKERPLRVAWMQPVPDGNDWTCEYVIEWPSKPSRSQRIFGVDSAQALLLAMKSASAELYVAEPQVYWYQPDDVLDLPLLSQVSDLEEARSKGR